jgi:hypothetical protein
MLVFRWLVLLMLLTSVGLFVFYAATGQARYKHLGLVVLKWTVAAGLVFFLVLMIERLTS